MRRSLACCRCKSTRRKSWWLASIFNHFVLSALASVTSGFILAIILTHRGSETMSIPEAPHEDAARQQKMAALLARLCEREEQLARIERERDEERRIARNHKREEQSLERQRQRAEKERSERELRDREALRRKIAELRAVVESQKEKITDLEAKAQRVGEKDARSNSLATHKPEPQAKSPVSESLKIIALARAMKAAEEEELGTQFLGEANQMLAAGGGSVRRARLVWLELIEKLPDTSAARQARRLLSDTRTMLDAENEKDAAKAMKAAQEAFHRGAAALARLRYGNILVNFPTTQAAKEAQKMFNLLR